MTRKRFGKLMMGNGVSRNVVREIVKTIREMKEAEDLWRHYERIGRKYRAAEKLCAYNTLKIRLCRWYAVTIRQQQEYAEKKRNLQYIKKKNSLTGV